MSLFDTLRAERASGRTTTVRDWLAANPPPEAAFRQTLAGVADRAARGEPFLSAVREFLDEYAIRYTPRLRVAATARRPRHTGDARQDAYLGALAEHLSIADGTAAPAWSREADRFLARFWFVSRVGGFRALAIAESPAAFRRRGIFISRGSLDRC